MTPGVAVPNWEPSGQSLASALTLSRLTCTHKYPVSQVHPQPTTYKDAMLAGPCGRPTQAVGVVSIWEAAAARAHGNQSALTHPSVELVPKSMWSSRGKRRGPRRTISILNMGKHAQVETTLPAALTPTRSKPDPLITVTPKYLQPPLALAQEANTGSDTADALVQNNPSTTCWSGGRRQADMTLCMEEDSIGNSHGWWPMARTTASVRWVACMCVWFGDNLFTHTKLLICLLICNAIYSNWQ
jgi:hypothetical protein